MVRYVRKTARRSGPPGSRGSGVFVSLCSQKNIFRCICCTAVMMCAFVGFMGYRMLPTSSLKGGSGFMKSSDRWRDGGGGSQDRLSDLGKELAREQRKEHELERENELLRNRMESMGVRVQTNNHRRGHMNVNMNARVRSKIPGDHIHSKNIRQNENIAKDISEMGDHTLPYSTIDDATNEFSNIEEEDTYSDARESDRDRTGAHVLKRRQPSGSIDATMEKHLDKIENVFIDDLSFDTFESAREQTDNEDDDGPEDERVSLEEAFVLDTNVNIQAMLSDRDNAIADDTGEEEEENEDSKEPIDEESLSSEFNLAEDLSHVIRTGRRPLTVVKSGGSKRSKKEMELEKERHASYSSTASSPKEAIAVLERDTTCSEMWKTINPNLEEDFKTFKATMEKQKLPHEESDRNITFIEYGNGFRRKRRKGEHKHAAELRYIKRVQGCMSLRVALKYRYATTVYVGGGIGGSDATLAMTEKERVLEAAAHRRAINLRDTAALRNQIMCRAVVDKALLDTLVDRPETYTYQIMTDLEELVGDMLPHEFEELLGGYFSLGAST